MFDLVVAIIGILFGLFTLQYYVYKQIFSRQHRLLPVLIVTMLLYCFYQVVLNLTGAEDVIGLLSIMLEIHVVYLCCHYLSDVMHLRIPLHVEIIMFVTLASANIITILKYMHPSAGLALFQTVFMNVYGGMTLLISIIELWKKFIPSKRERFTIGVIYLGIVLITLTAAFSDYIPHSNSMIILSLIVTEMLFLGLFVGGYIKDDPYAQRISLKNFSPEESGEPVEKTRAKSYDGVYMRALSHKMITPLNAIIAFSDLLINTRGIGIDGKNNAMQIKTAGNELLGYVNSMFSETEYQPDVSLDMNIDTEASFVYPDARVLLAEDMEVNQEVFISLCKQWQFEIDVANNGEEAVNLAKEKSYDLIFMDKMMPVMDGLEATKSIREFTNTPIVIFTADVSTDLSTKYQQFGVSDFISKPLELRKLKDVIERILPYTLRRENENACFDKPMVSEKILTIYKNELTEVSSALKGYFDSDLSMFRTKVHGIKSVSKQMGFMDIGESAEILEMAAKTENIAFIESHLDDFLAECNQVINSI